MATTHLRRGWRRTRNLALAIFFFVLGVIGVLVPVMPQVLFFVLSLVFFSLASRRVHRTVRGFLKRHPKLQGFYDRWRHKRRAQRRSKKR
ncbi:MAG: DUF454 family protein [Thermoanaerobaculia bacterium]